jgi:hypothetical protein
LLALTTQDRFDVVGFNENGLPWAGRPVRGHPGAAGARRRVARRDRAALVHQPYDAVETAFE